MYALGGVFRNRYFAQPGCRGGAVNRCYSFAPIEGIKPNDVNSSQFTVLAPTENYTVASAEWFLKGLYSHSAGAFYGCSESSDNATNGPQAGSEIQGPGMQGVGNQASAYPPITTVPLGQDPRGIIVQGSAFCAASGDSVWVDPGFTGYASDTQQFYQDLWWDGVFHDAYTLEQANFSNAYGLYEAAEYYWDYQNDTKLLITSDDLCQLRQLAVEEQWLRNGDLSASGLTPGDMIRGIAGRAVVSSTANFFVDNMMSCGKQSKLNLVFTSQEPFISFAAIANSDYFTQDGRGYTPKKFLPQPGSTMTFELFTYESDDGCKMPYPATCDQTAASTTASSNCTLYVRFVYHDVACPFGGGVFNGQAGAASGGASGAVSNGPAGGAGAAGGMSFVMPFQQFSYVAAQGSGDFIPTGWCSMCGGGAPFCPGDSDAWLIAVAASAAAIAIAVVVIVILTL